MEIKLFKGKRPAVVAGMIATAGLGMALTAAPAVAAAEELPADGGQQLAEAVEPGGATGSGDAAAVGGEQGGSQLPGGTEQPGDDQTGSGTEDGSQPGDGSGSGSEEESGGPASGTENGTGADNAGSTDEINNGTEGDVADSEETGKDESPAAGIEDSALADEILAIEDADTQADVELPAIGWTGNNYWDGTVADDGTAQAFTGWVVDDHAGTGLQRYFVENGVVKVDSVFQQVLAGVESWFYAQADGAILRGVGYKDGSPLIADEDGRLAEGWVVTDRFGQGLQRYWFIDGQLADEGVHSTYGGSWTYVTDQGYVLRGKHDNGAGRVYLADNDGNLAALGADGCGSGWLVTDEYDGGLQRYYIDGKAHAAVSGYFTVDASGLHAEGGPGESYFGLGGEGYVLRGAGRGVRSDWLYADNDGKLAKNEWVVTDDFGQGLQRYWFDGTATVAKEGLYNTGGGWWTYVTDQGYVLRGKKDTGRGLIYLADNDGRLVSGDGWLVTGLYDGGTLQRYYINGDAHAAVSGFFKAHLAGKDGSFFGLAGEGYILRGATQWGSVMLIANNDGFMVSSQGSSTTADHSNGKDYAGAWLVTDEFTPGTLQRYFITGIEGQIDYYGALVGKFAIGKNSDGDPIEYYGRNDTGYVVRGSYRAPDGTYYYANNDGVLDNFVMLDGGQLTEVGRRIWDAIMNKSSNTQYLIAVDRIACRTVVFQGSAGNWKPIYDWGCATGNPKYNSGNGTIVGEFQIGGQPGSWADHRWTGAAGENYAYDNSHYRTENWVGQGVTYFTGFILNCGFHSTAGNHSDPSQLGQRISHGCIRLLEKNAQWIFYNAGLGTKVIILPDNY